MHTHIHNPTYMHTHTYIFTHTHTQSGSRMGLPAEVPRTAGSPSSLAPEGLGSTCRSHDGEKNMVALHMQNTYVVRLLHLLQDVTAEQLNWASSEAAGSEALVKMSVPC